MQSLPNKKAQRQPLTVSLRFYYKFHIGGIPLSPSRSICVSTTSIHMLPHIFYFVNTDLENFLKYFFKTAQKNISTQKNQSIFLVVIKRRPPFQAVAVLLYPKDRNKTPKNLPTIKNLSALRDERRKLKFF